MERSSAGSVRGSPRTIALMTRRLLGVLLVAVLVSPAPAQALSQAGFAAELSAQLSHARHPFLQHGDLARERAALDSAYRQRAYAPLWLDANGELTAQAGAVLEALRSANELGQIGRAHV